MDGTDRLAEAFAADRERLAAVAYRMLGSRAEAEDAVQEAWLRLIRAGPGGIDNLGGWLTTVVARICLDALRARRRRGEEPLGPETPEPPAPPEAAPDREAILADSVGVAMLVVLEALTPAERVAFVLHDMFDLPFEEIAPIVGRTPVAARQLASRARRRVRGSPAPSTAECAMRRRAVEAFLAAARDGDFAGLMAVLDPDVVLTSDAAAVTMSLARKVEGAPQFAPKVTGAEAVAKVFVGRAKAGRIALVEGSPGIVWAPGGIPRVAFAFRVEGGRIAAIDTAADPARLAGMDIRLGEA